MVIVESSVSEMRITRFSELPWVAVELVAAGSVLDWGVGGGVGVARCWDDVFMSMPSSFLETLRVPLKNSRTMSSGLCFFLMVNLLLTFPWSISMTTCSAQHSGLGLALVS